MLDTPVQHLLPDAQDTPPTRFEPCAAGRQLSVKQRGDERPLYNEWRDVAPPTK